MRQAQRACFDQFFSPHIELISMEDEVIQTEPSAAQEKHPGLKEKTSDLADHVEQLATTYYKLGVLKVTQKASEVTSQVVAGVVTFIVAFFVVLFAGFGLSWWIGDMLDNRAAGFFLVGAFFLVIMIVFLMLRKQTILPFFRNLIVSKMYEDKNKDI